LAIPPPAIFPFLPPFSTRPQTLEQFAPPTFFPVLSIVRLSTNESSSISCPLVETSWFVRLFLPLFRGPSSRIGRDSPCLRDVTWHLFFPSALLLKSLLSLGDFFSTPFFTFVGNFRDRPFCLSLETIRHSSHFFFLFSFSLFFWSTVTSGFQTGPWADGRSPFLHRCTLPPGNSLHRSVRTGKNYSSTTFLLDFPLMSFFGFIL